MMSGYLSILEDSLKKKREILCRIQDINQSQCALFKDGGLDMEQYDSYVDEKDVCIKQLDDLDEGFEALYEKIRQELLQNKELYADQIRSIQKLIEEITDKSVSIQAQESRNRDMITAYFSKERQTLGERRKSSKAVYGYYQSIGKAVEEEVRIMDLKK